MHHPVALVHAVVEQVQPGSEVVMVLDVRLIEELPVEIRLVGAISPEPIAGIHVMERSIDNHCNVRPVFGIQDVGMFHVSLVAIGLDADAVFAAAILGDGLAEQGLPDLLLGNDVLENLAPSLSGKIKFESFDSVFDFITEKAGKEKLVFVIDEYPYLAKSCPYMNSLLQKYIDHDWKNTNLFLVLLGSLISFMREDVLGQNAPLHGRANLEMKLNPFDYKETALFVPSYTEEEKAIVYGLTGGVAKYLEQFDDSVSLNHNIEKLFFSENSCNS